MPDGIGPKGGWSEWSNHVLITLEKLEDKVNKLEESFHQDRLNTQREIVTLNTKATILGSIAGAVSATIMSIIAGLIVFNITTGNATNKTTENISPNGAKIEMVVPNRTDDLFVSSLSSDKEVSDEIN